MELKKKESAYSYCDGKLTRVVLAQSSFYGVAKVSPSHVVLEPHITADVRFGGYKEISTPVTLLNELIVTVEEVPKEDYDAIIEPHPWRKMENNYVHTVMKSGSYIGKLRVVERETLTLDEVMLNLSEGKVVTAQDILLARNDITTLVPLSQEKYTQLLERKPDDRT